MKFNYEIVIDAGLERVWEAFDEPRNLARWQQNLQARRQISGEPGQPGSSVELVYAEKGRDVILTQTITERRAPDFLAATYESANGSALIFSHFATIDGHTTRWTCWCNFRFGGAMRFLALFMVGAIRRRTEGDMERFKLMVESDAAGGN